jgi:general secretion pathway protein E
VKEKLLKLFNQLQVKESRTSLKTEAKPRDDAEIKAHAALLGIRSLEDLSSFTIDKTLTKKVSYSFVKKHLMLPVKEEENSILVATHDPFNLDAIEELRLLLGCHIETVFVPS